MKIGKNLIIIAGVVLVLGFWVKNKYNAFVSEDQEVENAWSKVESQYQRRSDLIPNIVSTAKGYAEFEKSTLTDVIEARSKATATTIDPSNITPQQIEAFQGAQSGLSSALSRLLVTIEKYPDLKANENFKELINELERTENQIAVERNRFNDTVKGFNKLVLEFPGNVLAGFFNFEERGYFKAEEGSSVAPKVEFDLGN